MLQTLLSFQKTCLRIKSADISPLDHSLQSIRELCRHLARLHSALTASVSRIEITLLTSWAQTSIEFNWQIGLLLARGSGC